MGNCLVTRLKGNVDNDNLVKLGYIRVKNGELVEDTVSNAIVLQLQLEFEDCAELHNATQNNSIVSWTSKDAWCDIKKSELRGIYNYGIGTGCASVNVEDIIGCNRLIRLEVPGRLGCRNSYGNLDKAGSFANLSILNLNYNPSITGNVSAIPQISTSLTELRIAGTNISGNANSFIVGGSLTPSGLTTLQFHGGSATVITPIQFNVSNIVICANNGCTVLIHENQIVWDTMTKTEFQAIIESLPTKPTVYWNS